MDLGYSWNVSLVVFTLLTVVLAVATILIVAILKRENRMFIKRLTKQINSLKIKNEDDGIDLSGLKKLMKYNLVEKKNDKILDIQNYFLQIEQKYKLKQISEKIIKRNILEQIRIQFMEHPMDMEGLNLSYLSGRLFLMYHYGQHLSKNSIVKPKSRSPKSKVPKSRPKGLGMTIKSHGPPTHPPTPPHL